MNHIAIECILDCCDPSTFMHLIQTYHVLYDRYKHLIPDKRKASLIPKSSNKSKYSGTTLKNYHVLPNGMKEGLYESFYRIGKLYRRCMYVNGKKHGPYEDYLPTGTLGVKCIYLEGIKDGPYEQHGPSDIVCDKYIYVKGKREGISKSYRDQKLYEKCTYVNDVKEGVCTGYDTKEGTMRSICNYVQGLMEGQNQSFYKDGSLRSMSTYSKGIRNGLHQEFDSSGNPVRSCIYAEGRIVA